MKNMRKSTNKRPNWRAMTLEERVRRAYERLPKALRNMESLEEKEQTIQATIGLYETDLADSKKHSPLNILRNKIEKRVPGYATKKEMFTAFRKNKSSLFHKYNSYMFRLGLKSTQYFMENADIDIQYIDDDSTKTKIIATLELPEGKIAKYGYLEFTVYIGLARSGIFEDAPISAIMW